MVSHSCVSVGPLIGLSVWLDGDITTISNLRWGNLCTVDEAQGGTERCLQSVDTCHVGQRRDGAGHQDMSAVDVETFSAVVEDVCGAGAVCNSLGQGRVPIL